LWEIYRSCGCPKIKKENIWIKYLQILTPFEAKATSDERLQAIIAAIEKRPPVGQNPEDVIPLVAGQEMPYHAPLGDFPRARRSRMDLEEVVDELPTDFEEDEDEELGESVAGLFTDEEER
jgi:hypothetical protein